MIRKIIMLFLPLALSVQADKAGIVGKVNNKNFFLKVGESRSGSGASVLEQCDTARARRFNLF
jgi:hypothetical protein